MASVRELLRLNDTPQMPCDEADVIAGRHLEEVEIKITRLEALRGELSRMLDQCAGGNISDCRVIEILCDHGECVSPDHLLKDSK